MKPFLGIDLTTNKKNDQLNGNVFLAAKSSLALSQALEQSHKNVDETVAQAKLPKFFRIVQFLCGITAALLFSGILKADVSLAQGYHNAPWIYWTFGICLIIWLVLKLLSLQKEKLVLSADENAQVFSHWENTTDAVFAEFSIPTDAKEVDVLSFFYKLKDGNIKVCEKGMQVTQYFNPIFKIFSDSEYLYLANLEGKYAFPLSSVMGIRTIKKHIRIAGWNKEVPYNKGIYKQYKLTIDNYGCIHCKSYHILELNHNGEIWGIYFPSYELPVIEEITK